MRKIGLMLSLALFGAVQAFAQQTEQNHAVRFEQLGPMLRTPNVYRTPPEPPAISIGSKKPTT